MTLSLAMNGQALSSLVMEFSLRYNEQSCRCENVPSSHEKKAAAQAISRIEQSRRRV